MKFLLLVMTTLVLTACSNSPTFENLVSQNAETKGLFLVSNTHFDEFYSKRSATLAGYDKLYFNPLDLSALEVDVSRLDLREQDWVLKDQERQLMQGYFDERVKRVFSTPAGNVFQLADAAGQGVLAVTLEALKFTPNAAKDDGQNRALRADVFTRSVGDLKFNVRVNDSQTGQLLMFIRHNDKIGNVGYLARNDRNNNIRQLKITMEKWVRLIRIDIQSIVDAD